MTETHALRSVQTSNLPDLFHHLQIGVVASTSQAGKVILGRNDDDPGSLDVEERCVG